MGCLEKLVPTYVTVTTPDVQPRLSMDMPTIDEVITPHAQRERGKVIDCGVHIYVYGRKKKLNRTLEINSPFQTLTVGLLVEFID